MYIYVFIIYNHTNRNIGRMWLLNGEATVKERLVLCGYNQTRARVHLDLISFQILPKTNADNN